METDRNLADQHDIENAERPPPSSMLARSARFLNHALPQTYAAFSMMPRLAVAYRWIRRLESTGMASRLSQLPIERYKTSDTIFVFGTGASINSYPEDWWRSVREHDSIGMNFFLLHEHVPTYHVMEGLNGDRRFLLEHRYVRRQDYLGVPLILKSQLSNLSSKRIAVRVNDLAAIDRVVQSHTYLSVDVLAAGTTVEEMAASYRLFGKLGLWSPKERFLMLNKRRGSVALVLNFALRAGYKKVVLCGIDLNHTEYFYDSRRADLEAAGMRVPPNDESGGVHSTNDPVNHPVTIHEVILAIGRLFLEPAGVQLFVGSDSSALYPDVPMFDWASRSRAGPSPRPGQDRDMS